MRLARFALVAAAAIAVAASGALADGSAYLAGVQGWDGVVARDRFVRYVALPSGRRTVLAEVRVEGGRVVQFRSFAGSYGVPQVAFDGTTEGLSRDGRTLVLSPTGVGRASRFAVVDPQRFRLRATFRLRGTFSFDALSPGARTLYLIEHFSLGNAPRYRVRAYDLVRMRLLARPVVDPRERGAMRGLPASRATSRDGRWAYTLYRGGGEGPFVHALDTVRRAAVCVDLPRAGSRLALRGSRIVVLNRGHEVAAVDARTLRVIR